MMPAAERVALLALCYQELARGAVTGAITAPADIIEDIECCPSEMSLLRLAATNLPPIDFDVAAALWEAPEQLPQLLTHLEADELRQEALLHAWPADVQRPPFPLLYAERWPDVEEAMERWCTLGITVSRHEVELTACKAIAATTGETFVAVQEEMLN